MQQITSSNFKFNELPNLPFTAQKEKEQNNQINQSTNPCHKYFVTGGNFQFTA